MLNYCSEEGMRSGCEKQRGKRMQLDNHVHTENWSKEPRDA